MFPNPQDALPLPPRPNLDQYKKRAKDLLKASQSPDPAAIRTWAATWIDSLVRLSDLTLTPQLPVRIDHWTDELENFARRPNAITRAARLSRRPNSSSPERRASKAGRSWRSTSKPSPALTLPSATSNKPPTPSSRGDIAILEKLLRDNPDLIRTPLTRRHQATLLHYVSANGIEGYRQKTPNNIVQITDLLLRAGADVNAVADVYGGSTTLALVATSVHPERAGVQESLMQLLLDHGANIDAANSPAGPLINVCLANGRAQAAEFLATRGAHLDLEGAAGVGRLDVVQ